MKKMESRLLKKKQKTSNGKKDGEETYDGDQEEPEVNKKDEIESAEESDSGDEEPESECEEEEDSVGNEQRSGQAAGVTRKVAQLITWASWVILQ